MKNGTCGREEKAGKTKETKKPNVPPPPPHMRTVSGCPAHRPSYIPGATKPFRSCPLSAVRCPLVVRPSVRQTPERRLLTKRKEKKRNEKSRSPRSPIGGRRPPSKLGSAWVRRKRTRAWAGERKKKKRGGGALSLESLRPAVRWLRPCVDTPHRPPSIIQRSVHPSIHPPIHRSARRPVVGRAATQPQSPEGGGDVIRRKR